MRDEEIVKLFFERDERAVAESEAAYGPYCRAVAYRILENEDDALECVNDTLYRAWESIPPNRPENLKAYLGRITRNLAFSLYRKAAAKRRGGGAFTAVLDELAECVPGGTEPEAEWEKKELVSCLNGFLAAQPKENRQLFVARYFGAESVADIAKRFGLRENTVSARLSRMRKSLRDHLAERGYGI